MADSNSLNEFTVLGFVGKDPTLVQCKDPTKKFCALDIATQERYKGREQPKVTWHHVQIWGTKMAPWAAGAVKKGMQVLVKGKMAQRQFKYYDSEGREHMKEFTEFKVEEFIILRQKKTADEPKETTPNPPPVQQKDPY